MAAFATTWRELKCTKARSAQHVLKLMRTWGTLCSYFPGFWKRERGLRPYGKAPSLPRALGDAYSLQERMGCCDWSHHWGGGQIKLHEARRRKKRKLSERGSGGVVGCKGCDCPPRSNAERWFPRGDYSWGRPCYRTSAGDFSRYCQKWSSPT